MGDDLGMAFAGVEADMALVKPEIAPPLPGCQRIAAA